MANAKKLCLNMIVKNEMANLERCLSSVADHIDCWVIGDTGSTDGTPEFIRSFFAARNIPGELHSFPFHNFEQARNAGLDCAYASRLVYDYLLFDDADMELVVEDRDFRTKLTASAYTVLQRAGISYWNTRLVRRSVGARYRGVTHEYVDIPGGGSQQLQGIWYKDHASGSNRVDKFERDIRLLKEGLEKEPESTRYWFYLAQSYRDAGQTEKAVETYAKRAAMGGWDEEAWYARLQQARALRKLGDEGGFIREALAAFNQRPQRAEPLYDLAKYYREKGSNHASVLFAEFGLPMERPNDILFLEDFVYTAGLKEEYSIAANYSPDPARKDRGHAACNWLALNRTIPEGTRNLARSNLFFYVESASTMMPSFSARQVAFTPPDGYRASNPSITRRDNEIVLVQRCVNYTVSEDARHYNTPNNAPIQTRNYLVRLSESLDTRSSTEILAPVDMPEPSFGAVLGFEDMRLFAWRNELWTCSTIREQNREGYCEQVLARLEEHEPGPYRLANWRVLRPNAPRRHEKNWMPYVVGETLQFMYLCDPTHVIDEQARTVSETTPSIMGGDFRGGSQLIEFDGGWLTLIHEVIFRNGARVYLHRFVWFDKANSLKRVSRLFFFQKKGIEFAAGLAWHPDRSRLIASYGVGDGESWIATIDAGDVRKILDDAEQLPWGGPKPNSNTEVTEVPQLPHLSIAPEISPLGTDVDHTQVGETNLVKIFQRCRTDKLVNGYAGLYEALFSKGRHEIRRVLEIGIGTMIPGAPSSMVGFAPEGYKPGASLRAWREFFPNATIYGADIQPDTQFNDEERIVTVLCDSSDSDQVKQLMRKLNNEQFDIIIDDGSHILANQLKTLRNLYPFLKSGGFYIVEDCGHNAMAKQAGAIREICGDIAFFSAGPHENPLVLTKRPDGRASQKGIRLDAEVELGTTHLVVAGDLGACNVEDNPVVTVSAKARQVECARSRAGSESNVDFLSAKLNDTDHALWAKAETNRALRNSRAVDEARAATASAHLPLHPDPPKAWDNLLALFHTTATTEPNVPVLDAGAGRESVFLPGLRELGYTDLTGINLLERGAETVNGICYRFGDITKTEFNASHFGFVACLSVIEHGVDCELFFKEMARILRPDGHLFLSMDYWQDPIDAGDRIAFGVPVKIFAASDVTNLVRYASQAGLVLVGDMDLSCQQRTIDCFGLQYTFCNLFFRRSPDEMRASGPIV